MRARGSCLGLFSLIGVDARAHQRYSTHTMPTPKHRAIDASEQLLLAAHKIQCNTSHERFPGEGMRGFAHRVGFALAELSMTEDATELDLARAVICGALESVSEWHGTQTAVDLLESITAFERSRL